MLFFFLQESEILSLKKQLHDLTCDENNNEEEQSKVRELESLEAYVAAVSEELNLLQRHKNKLEVLTDQKNKQLFEKENI